MSSTLDESYAQCRRIARRTAGNFYYAFYVLPRDQRRAMCALYAFLRHSDDLGDSALPAAERRAALACWRASFERALAGTFDDTRLPALADTVARFGIPPKHLHDVLDGVEMDLDVTRYETFDELREYCYRVASAVGLACLHIWGCASDDAREPAIQVGIAFQLTNIIRDLAEDAGRGRVYLPQEDLRRFGYDPEGLASGVYDKAFQELLRFEIARAKSYYDAGNRLREHLNRHGRRTFGVMFAIYRGLLGEIERRKGNVFGERIRLSRWRKAAIALRGLIAG